MQLLALMITKEDHEILGEWCREQLPLYDALVCLDGSENPASAAIARRYAPRLLYFHERDFRIPHKTDHGLRAIVHDELVRHFGRDNWIMCCHADEFCYHDPRKIAAKADQDGYDSVSWFSLHFFPHSSERADWSYRRSWPIAQRFRHYHWNYRGDGLPWLEDRLYRNGANVRWDAVSHGNVLPLGLTRAAPYHPALKHYKVFTTDLAWYDGQPDSTLYRSHWRDQKHRTGLPFRVGCLDDLFVDHVPPYASCDFFDGTFDQAWNMGEDYRIAPAKNAVRLLR
jgi:hypothetical protein